MGKDTPGRLNSTDERIETSKFLAQNGIDKPLESIRLVHNDLTSSGKRSQMHKVGLLVPMVILYDTAPVYHQPDLMRTGIYFYNNNILFILFLNILFIYF